MPSGRGNATFCAYFTRFWRKLPRADSFVYLNYQLFPPDAPSVQSKSEAQVFHVA